MRLTRRTDWQQRLDELVVARMRTPFAWGGNDCTTFAAAAVACMTDAHLIPLEAGRWSSAREAFRALRAYGGLAGAVRTIGLEEVSPRLARRGDVVLLRAPARPSSMRGALGICLGERIAAPGEHEMVFARLSEGVTAWRV